MPIGTLIINDGSNQRKSCVVLDDPTVKIGTAPNSSILVSDECAEALHLEIRSASFYTLKCYFKATDTCTRLNNHPLHPEEFRLNNGDVITIGQTRLEFRLLEADPPLIELEVSPAESVGIMAGHKLTRQVRVYNYTANRETIDLAVQNEQGAVVEGWITAFELATLPLKPAKLTLEPQSFADVQLKITPDSSAESPSGQVALTVVATWGDNKPKATATFNFLNLATAEQGLPLTGGAISGALTVEGKTTLIGDLTVGGRGTIGALENGATKLLIDGDLKLQEGVAINAFSVDDNLAASNDKTVPTAPAIERYVDRQIQAGDQASAQAAKAYVDQRIRASDQTSAQAAKVYVDQQIQAVRDAIADLPHDTQPMPAGVIVMWSGITPPSGWVLCDGTHGAPDLSYRFIIGAGKGFPPRTTGGAEKVTLGIEHLPSHNHANGAFDRVLKVDNGPYTINLSNMRLWADNDGKGKGRFENYQPVDTYNPSGQEPNLFESDALQPVGGGEPFRIYPPYYALAFIMKV